MAIGLSVTQELGVPSVVAHHPDDPGVPLQTVGLLKAARHLYTELPADVILIVTETPLDLDEVYAQLAQCRVLVAVQNPALAQKIKAHQHITLLDIQADPKPIEERISLALLKAVANEQLQPGAHVVLLYSGIAADPN